jgi:hypothetical protein
MEQVNNNHAQEAGMKLKELKDHLKSVPDDYDVKVSSYFVKEGQAELKYFEGANEKFTAVNDESILGISRKDSVKQIHIIGVKSHVDHFGSGDFSKDSE